MMAVHGGFNDVFDLLVTNEADRALADSADDTVLHLGEIGLVEDVFSHGKKKQLWFQKTMIRCQCIIFLRRVAVPRIKSDIEDT